LNIYKDLLAIPRQEVKDVQVQDDMPQSQSDQVLIHDVDLRLHNTEPLPGDTPLPITDVLLQHRTQQLEVPDGILKTAEDHPPETVMSLEEPYRRVLSRLREIIVQMETVQSSIFSSQENESTMTLKEPKIPISILSLKEWEALVRVCVCVSLLSV
jgi:hypothetical protein